jgi:hypothetical protein
VTQNPDHLGRAEVGAVRPGILSTLALALAAMAALTATVTDADASAREISASSYGFADSLLPNNGLEPLPMLPLSGRDWAFKCSANCGPAFGTYVTQRSEMLTSNNADISTRKTADSGGRPMGGGGMVVVERLEPDASGSLMNWVVVSERTVDDNGSHSWSRLSSAPSNMPWIPTDLYRFEGSSFSMDLRGEAPTTPEASTWVMMLIGFAGLGMAGHRSSKTRWRPLQLPKGDTSR